LQHNMENLTNSPEHLKLGNKDTSKVTSLAERVNSSQEYLHRSIERIHETIHKLENEKVASLTQEVGYLRQVVEFQNNKIEKLTSLIAEYFENKNQDAIISSLQAIQDNVIDHDEGVLQDEVNQVSHSDLGSQGVHLDGNMDPALHQVAVAAAAVQAQVQAQVQASKHDQGQQHSHQHNHQQLTQGQHHDQLQARHLQAGQSDVDKSKKKGTKRKHDHDGQSFMEEEETKKPKINVDFLHNPMSVKEIYDEFTKGFRGQIPLKEMDAKYGKNDWRGDSRSKESKRFQRRKKLYDAIERGCAKYGKPAEEIILYIEEFRGEKSLTWIMNGNLPSDLMS